jgi:hypothetical protein
LKPSTVPRFGIGPEMVGSLLLFVGAVGIIGGGISVANAQNAVLVAQGWGIIGGSINGLLAGAVLRAKRPVLSCRRCSAVVDRDETVIPRLEPPDTP